ncbi:hypothetical protein J7J18_04685 [bacterium]|nr:hypothetical protein [bacterium]
MRGEKEIRELIAYASEKQQEAYDKLDVRTTVYFEGLIDGLFWVLLDKDLPYYGLRDEIRNKE